MNKAGVEARVRFQERPERLRRNVAAAGQRHVRMERAQVGLETGGEERFLDAFVKLEQMRMAGPDSDPDDLGPAFARKCSEADERKEKSFPGNRPELFRKRFLSVRRDVAKKS